MFQARGAAEAKPQEARLGSGKSSTWLEQSQSERKRSAWCQTGRSLKDLEGNDKIKTENRQKCFIYRDRHYTNKKYIHYSV